MKEQKSIKIAKSIFFGNSPWFRIPKRILTIMNWDEAIMLSFLMNYHLECLHLNPEEEFYCSEKHIDQELGIPLRTQSRIFKKLKEHGWISTRKENKTYPHQMITVDYNKLLNELLTTKEN